MENKITYHVNEAAEIIGISKSLMYKLVQDDAIPNIRLGNRILIPRKKLLEFLEESEF
jgi:excisionase family DNA binding protein